MATFDDIAVQRPALAQAYLDLLSAQPGRPLALFAPRRVGKTFFLDNDLAPAAQSKGILPIYADLWLYKSAPLEAINHALEEALDDLTIPSSNSGKTAKTPVKGVGAFGVSLALGDGPTRRKLPEEPNLRFDSIIQRLTQAHNGHVLLLLDEVQTLGETVNSTEIIAVIRAVLHKHKARVSAVFTGSSQQGLARIMNTAGAPMYQFAQLLDFPFLGTEYLEQLSKHFSTVHPRKRLPLAALEAGFARIGYRPALMKDIIKSMSAEGITDVHAGIANFMRSDSQLALWDALLQTVDVYDQGVLMVVAKQLPPLGKEARAFLASWLNLTPTLAKTRASIERLQRQGLLSKTAAETTIDDPLFAEYLLSKTVQQANALPT